MAITARRQVVTGRPAKRAAFRPHVEAAPSACEGAQQPSWAKEADFSCGDERSDCGRVFQLTTPVRQCPVGSHCAQAARPRSARMRARLRRTAPPIGQAGVLSVLLMPSGLRRLPGPMGPAPRQMRGHRTLPTPNKILIPPRASGQERPRRHSITSSARARTVGGTVRPSALAVLRLITISILVENSIGRSPGLAPFKILSTNAAAWRLPSAWLTP